MKDLKELLVAQALADAYGYVVEFMDIGSIKSYYGDDFKFFDYAKSRDSYLVSDDTQMTLFTLEGLIELEEMKNNNLNIDEDSLNKRVYASYKRWYATQNSFKEQTEGIWQFKPLWESRAPGITCLGALSGSTRGTIHNELNNSKGCGGIMRVLPNIFFVESMEEAFKNSIDQAAMTHGHVSGFLSAGFYSALGYGLLNDMPVDEVMKKAKIILRSYNGHEEVLSYVKKAEELLKNNINLKNDEMIEELGGGWTGETAMAIAIYVGLQEDKTYENILEWSANHSGDSDSTAMLAAGLWYLKNNDNSFMKYADKIDVIEAIDYLDNKNTLLKSATNNIEKKIKI